MFEAEPKSSSRDGVKDDDNRRLYTQSATPTDMNRPGHLSGHSRYSPALVDYDRNPNFWAWMYSQNVDVHHVTQSLKTIKQLHSRFAQETGALAGHSMSQSISSCDDWVLLPFWQLKAIAFLEVFARKPAAATCRVCVVGCWSKMRFC